MTKPLFLFVRPPRPLWPFNGPSSAFWPPLAFASLAAVLRDQLPDVRVEILDAPALRMGWRKLEAELWTRRPAFIGIGEEAVSCVEGLRLAHLGKRLGARVVAGGCFFGQAAAEVLRTGLIDVVVHGEGELTLVEVVQALSSGSTGDLGQVRGISFMAEGTRGVEGPTAEVRRPTAEELVRAQRELSPTLGEEEEEKEPDALWNLRPTKAEVITTPARELIADLDTLPLPAYDLLPVERYGAESVNHPQLASIELGRGCFGSCDFCVLWRQMGRPLGERMVPHLRVKSPERLLEEINLLTGRYERRYLGWVDPCFNADVHVPARLAELMLRKGLRVGQSAWARTDALVRDARSGALATCVEAGLNELYLGIERPDAASLNRLRKSSGPEDAREALSILHEQFPEVLAVGSFIYGLAGDSPATVRAIHRLAIELELDQFFFIPLTPLPGTAGWSPELWDGTGERLRELNFLPSGRPHGKYAALERALLWSLLFHWPAKRIRAWWRRFARRSGRKRRVQRRLFMRGASFHLRRVLRRVRGGPDDFGLVFPRWYES